MSGPHKIFCSDPFHIRGYNSDDIQRQTDRSIEGTSLSPVPLIPMLDISSHILRMHHSALPQFPVLTANQSLLAPTQSPKITDSAGRAALWRQWQARCAQGLGSGQARAYRFCLYSLDSAR